MSAPVCHLCEAVLGNYSLNLDHRMGPGSDLRSVQFCQLACLEGWIAALQIKTTRQNEEFELAQRLDFIREQRMAL